MNKVSESYNSHVSQLMRELQRAAPILEVAFGEMGAALACVTCFPHANQRSDWRESEQ